MTHHKILSIIKCISILIGIFGTLWLIIESASYFQLDIAEKFRLSGGWGYTVLVLLSLVLMLVYLLKTCKTVEKSVSFWNTIIERQTEGIDVRGLLSNSKTYVFLSGITMHYVIQSCREELRSALMRGVKIDIVTAMNDDSKVFYRRYSNINLISESHTEYRNFFNSLSNRERNLLRVYTSSIIMTHSIGKYDEEIFVSEFCIDTDSLHVPSYRLTLVDQAYTVFNNEISILMNESICIVGT